MLHGGLGLGEETDPLNQKPLLLTCLLLGMDTSLSYSHPKWEEDFESQLLFIVKRFGLWRRVKTSYLVLSHSLRVIARVPVLGYSWWEEMELVELVD